MPETQKNNSCQIKRPGDPCAIVLFGASGDLTSKKLMPALYGLFVNNYLPGSFYIIGCARTELTDDSFRDRMRASIENVSLNNEGKIDEFLGRLYYRQIKYDDPASYVDLSGRIESLDKENSIPANRLFYLAVPPNLYNNISNMLGSSGLSSVYTGLFEKNNWTRIVVEKPFGRDLETAKALNRSLKRSFKEDQIYRIDHYLAKETVQNILFFRFANTIFEPLWSSKYIEYVDILAAEKNRDRKKSGLL